MNTLRLFQCHQVLPFVIATPEGVSEHENGKAKVLLVPWLRKSCRHEACNRTNWAAVSITISELDEREVALNKSRLAEF